MSLLVNSDLNENHSDSTDDDIHESGLNDWDFCLLDPEEQYHYLPRSSPVISRKRCDAERLTSTNYDLPTFPFIAAKSNITNQHRMNEFTYSKKLKEPQSVSDKDLISVSHQIKDSSPKDILEQSDFRQSKCDTGGISPISQRILSRSAPASARSRVPLNKSYQSRPKRRACSDVPPAFCQRSLGNAKKHGSFFDVHSSDEAHSCSLDQVS